MGYSYGYEAGIVKLELVFVVVETRIEARIVKLDARTSSCELRASLPASSPITV